MDNYGSSTSTFPDVKDIDDQLTDNYGYDLIGNLTKDSKAGIDNGGIVWDLYGRITSITKTVNGLTTLIEYTYDRIGNRIGKKITENSTLKSQTFLKYSFSLFNSFTAFTNTGINPK